MTPMTLIISLERVLCLKIIDGYQIKNAQSQKACYQKGI